jgi:tetratricopeptide (TPR) repeat protein
LEVGKASRPAAEASSPVKAKVAAPEVASPSTSASAESNRLKDAGNEALGKEKLDDAIALYTQALQVDPDNLAALNNRSLAFLKLNRFVDAERDASGVLRRDAGNVKALYRRGVARRSLGDRSALEGALADFDALLAAEPGNKTARAERTKVQQALADLAIAKARAPAAAATGTSTAASVSSTPVKKPSSAEPISGSPSSLLGPVKNPTKAMSPLSSVSAPTSAGDTSSIGLTARSTTIRKPKPATDSSEVPPATPGGIQAESPAIAVSPPASSRISPRAHAESAEKRARMMAAPSQPPKTLYELERVWRGLKSRPDLFAQYLQTFTRSTFREVFKEAITPDLLSSVIAALRTHLVESAPSDALRVLDGLTDMPKFGMTVALLPSTDETRLREAFAVLARAMGPGEEVTQVAAKFNIQV